MDNLNNIVSVINPEMIILGGGIMAQKVESARPLIDKALQQKLVENVYEKTVVDFAMLGNNAGILGALYNLLHTAE